jgi:hypothetical protein
MGAAQSQQTGDTRSALIGYYMPMLVTTAKRIQAAVSSNVEISLDSLMTTAIWTLWDLIQNNLAGEGIPAQSELIRTVRRAIFHKVWSTCSDIGKP